MSRYVGTILGFSTAAVFLAVGIALLSEGRDRWGAFLLALGALRAVLAVKQLMTTLRQTEGDPPPVG